MAIKVITDDSEFDIGEGDDFAEGLERLSTYIAPDTPVMVSRFETSTQAMTSPRSREKVLMYSDGSFNEGTIEPRNGVRNQACAVSRTMSDNFDHFILPVKGISVPNPVKVINRWSGSRDHYNEGTFSSAGPSRWKTFHGGGTDLVIVGEEAVRARFPDVLDSILFAESGIPFAIPTFYSMPGYMITHAGTKDVFDSAKETEASRIATLGAARRLINNAARMLKTFNFDEMYMAELGWYHHGADGWGGDELPITNEDYIVVERPHPERIVGYVKARHGVCYGHGVALPSNVDGARETIDLAFSEDFMAEYFPAK